MLVLFFCTAYGGKYLCNFNGTKWLVSVFLSWLNTLSSQVKTQLQTAKERL